MAITTELSGAELAEHLAKRLSDLEFELLVRARILNAFAKTHVHIENLGDSYNSCSFTMSWGDNALWRVGIGQNYNTSAEISGQVLDKCMQQVETLYRMKNANKLSFLLPPPAPPITFGDDEDQ